MDAPTIMAKDAPETLPATMRDPLTKELPLTQFEQRMRACSGDGAERKSATRGELWDLIGTAIEAHRSLAARVRALEEAAAATPKYRGVWKVDEAYPPGSFVTFEGSVWHANAATKGTRPGDGQVWTLAVKKGRDAR